MNKSELRIGNFIEYEATTHVVEELHSDKVLHQWLQGAGSGYVTSYKSIKGIELTPEWLTLLGFDAYTYASELSGMITEYTFNNLSIVDFESSGKNFVLSNAFNFNVRPKVKYVHHLQNLVHAILGRELELKK